MRKYRYTKHYDFKSLIPLKRIKAEVGRVENGWILAKNFTLYTGILLWILTIAVIVYIKLKYQDNRGRVWMIPAIFLPPIIGSLLIFISYKIAKKMRADVQNIPIVQKVIGKGSPFYYNHMLKKIPELKGIVITGASEIRSRTFNDDFVRNLKSFSLDASQVHGCHLEFTYKGHNFIFTNEYVRKRSVPRYNKNHHVIGYDNYYTYVNALLSVDLSGADNQIFYIRQKRALNPPSNFKLFESESVEFNKKLSVYYNGDDLIVFEKFNPLVVDSFNQVDLTYFKNAYANTHGVVSFDIDETTELNETKLNSIFNIQVTGRGFMNDLEQSFRRFERNLARLSRKFNFVKPFYD